MMYIEKEFVVAYHVRTSKRGTTHTYGRRKTVLVFKCDNCGDVFKRDRGDMDPKRLNNNYYHVCGCCDAKKFAQSKGVEARKIWDLPVSSLKTIDKL